MTVYSGPVFDMAAKQFGVIADYLEIPFDERGRLLLPKRAITVSCPIHRDDGTTAVFEGYRVQHHLTLGPTKGGTRFASSVDLGWQAVDTRSNADETARWVRRHGYRTVRLVTSDWHMPRARLELSHALGKDAEVIGDPVRSHPPFAMLFREYHKYLLRRAAVLVGAG